VSTSTPQQQADWSHQDIEWAVKHPQAQQGQDSQTTSPMSSLALGATENFVGGLAATGAARKLGWNNSNGGTGEKTSPTEDAARTAAEPKTGKAQAEIEAPQGEAAAESRSGATLRDAPSSRVVVNAERAYAAEKEVEAGRMAGVVVRGLTISGEVVEGAALLDVVVLGLLAYGIIEYFSTPEKHAEK
jgi:hypothetical protein